MSNEEWQFAVCGSVGSLQTTTSTVYVDLTTPGPSVSVWTGDSALVLSTVTVGQVPSANNTGYFAVAVSGATTVAAADAKSGQCTVSTPGDHCIARYEKITGLTPGLNTFTIKYRAFSSGSSMRFSGRSIAVISL